MKVCNVCSFEHDGKDGENVCETCRRASNRRRQQRKRRSREIDDAMKDLGLVKVRGAMGGTYYE